MPPLPPETTIKKSVRDDGSIEWQFDPAPLNSRGKYFYALLWLLALISCSSFVFLIFQQSSLPFTLFIFSLLPYILQIPSQRRQQLITLNSSCLLIKGTPHSPSKLLPLNHNGPKPNLQINFLPNIRRPVCRFRIENTYSAYFQIRSRKVSVGYFLNARDLLWFCRDYYDEARKSCSKPKIEVSHFGDPLRFPIPPNALWRHVTQFLIRLSIAAAIVCLSYYWIDQALHYQARIAVSDIPELQEQFNQEALQKTSIIRDQFLGTFGLFSPMFFLILARIFKKSPHSPYSEISLTNESLVLIHPENSSSVRLPLDSITWIHGDKTGLSIGTDKEVFTIHRPLWNSANFASDLRTELGLF